jgi:hypothetical protein
MTYSLDLTGLTQLTNEQFSLLAYKYIPMAVYETKKIHYCVHKDSLPNHTP